MNDLRLLCDVYRELSYDDALLSLGMAVLEDGKEYEIMKEVVRRMNEENLRILIEYGVELMNCSETGLWKNELELEICIVKEVLEKCELFIFGQPLSQVYSLLEQARFFYNTFEFCLPSSFIQNYQETCERIITACVQPEGYSVMISE